MKFGYFRRNFGQISEGGTAEVQGERLEAKLRKVLQIVPGHRFVLLGKSG